MNDEKSAEAALSKLIKAETPALITFLFTQKIKTSTSKDHSLYGCLLFNEQHLVCLDKFVTGDQPVKIDTG